MPDNVARLLKMAEAEFPDLTEPEREVVRCAANGELADLSPLGPPTPPELETKLAKKFNPGGRQLRSAVVEWLCTDERVKNRVHRKGVFIIHASLDEVLDLQHADVPFFFGLHACRLPGLDAQGARIGSNLYLRLCHIDGRFDLNSSRIGGQLLCDGTRVQGADGISIRADGADIGGIVFLSNGFRAVGEVRLLGAKIKGQLNCKNGHFQNHDGKALNLDNAAIEYDVLLSEGFQAVGEVRLMGAKIQGQLNCNGGTFQNEAGYALNLQGAVISDAMFLEPKRLRGEVGLHGAEVTGTLRMLSDSTAKASLDLRSAKVGVLFDSRDSWPEAGKIKLDGLVYDDIDHNSPRSVAERLEWLGRMSSYQFLPQPYEQLAAWFQRIGHDKEAVTTRIALEDIRSQFFTQKWAKCWRRLIFWTVGYGYKPYYAMGWLFILWLIGAGFFWYGYPQGITKSASHKYSTTQQRCDDLDNCTEPLGMVLATNYPLFNPFIYSLDVALPIVDLQQERFWMPDSESKAESNGILKSGVFLWWVNWFEVLLGWIFASIGIAGATGIIRKD